MQVSLAGALLAGISPQYFLHPQPLEAWRTGGSQYLVAWVVHNIQAHTSEVFGIPGGVTSSVEVTCADILAKLG